MLCPVALEQIMAEPHSGETLKGEPDELRSFRVNTDYPPADYFFFARGWAWS